MKKILLLLLFAVFLQAQNSPSIEFSLNYSPEFQGGYLIFSLLQKSVFSFGGGIGGHRLRLSPAVSLQAIDVPCLAEARYFRGERFFSSFTGGFFLSVKRNYQIDREVIPVWKTSEAPGLGLSAFVSNNIGYRVSRKWNLTGSFFANIPLLFSYHEFIVELSLISAEERPAYGLRFGIEYILK